MSIVPARSKGYCNGTTRASTASPGSQGRDPLEYSTGRRHGGWSALRRSRPADRGGPPVKGPAATVIERCDILADISEEPGVLVRPYGSRAMREVNDVVSGWMREAGMTPRRDGIGNLTGRYEGTGDKTLILGSHLDTVRDAGKYNGT